MVTMAIPASSALASASEIASGFGAETAMPSQPSEMKDSINCACS